MIDPRKNTEVYHEEVVEVYNRAFSKSFIDALLTQIRFQNSLHIFLPKLYADLNFKDSAHKSSPWRLFNFGVCKRCGSLFISR